MLTILVSCHVYFELTEKLILGAESPPHHHDHTHLNPCLSFSMLVSVGFPKPLVWVRTDPLNSDMEGREQTAKQLRRKMLYA